MPAFATHYVFAKSLEDTISGLYPDLTFSKSAFYYGTQGPDFLFSHRVWRMAYGGETLKELGSLLHHCNISKLLRYMKEYCETQSCDRNIVRSYIYGFICHYALDRNTHPLIYAIQKEMTEHFHYENRIPFTVHNIIEFNIDTVLLETQLNYRNGLEFKGYSVLDDNEYLIDEMAGLIAYAVPKTVFTAATKEDFVTAFKDMILSHKMLNDSKGIKRKVLGILQKPIENKVGTLLTGMIRQKECDNKWDYLNITKKEWAMVFDSTKKSTDSFMDRYYLAQNDALELISAYETENPEENIREICGDMSFDTGLRYDIEEPV